MNYYDGNTVTGLWNYAQRYVAMSGKNIGDLLNEAGLSWGWFQGGFDPSTPYAAAAAAVGHAGQPTSTFIPDEFSGKFNDTSKHQSNQGICNSTTPVGTGLPGAMKGTGQYGYKDNYIPHHEPFQYYASTANPHHLTSRPTARAPTPSRH
jgi:phospholipase C